MAQQDDGQEKSLEPTQRRLEKAREKGDVAKSNDVNAVATYIGLMLALVIAGAGGAVGFAAPLTAFLGEPELIAQELLEPGGRAIVGEILTASLSAAAPVLLAPLAAVLISLLAQQAIVFAPSKLEPKISRIDPIANAGQKFGPTGLVEFAKSSFKLVAIATVLTVIFIWNHDGLGGLAGLDARVLPQMLYYEALLLLGATIGIAGAIAALDLVWQRYDHARKLRMSQQDMKEEAKESEGDPHLKQARQRRAREIAANRMLSDVPKADVVVVNPTHFAVALKWSRTPGSAPVCVAKGVDEIARRIRETAEEHGVPIHSDPPTARVLHAALELGEEIRPEHYQAVAAAIRFADMVRAQAAEARGRDTWR